MKHFKKLLSVGLVGSILPCLAAQPDNDTLCHQYLKLDRKTFAQRLHQSTQTAETILTILTNCSKNFCAQSGGDIKNCSALLRTRIFLTNTEILAAHSQTQTFSTPPKTATPPSINDNNNVPPTPEDTKPLPPHEKTDNPTINWF